MRLRTVLLVVAGAAVVYLIAARETRPVATGPADGARPAPQAGAVDLDSVRAIRSAILRRIGDADTYLSAMLVEMDSVLRRWSERRDEPLRVYFPDGGPQGYMVAFRRAVQRAFVTWTHVGDVPVRFKFVRDPAGAEVEVGWIERFPERRTGQADVVWNGDGWLVRADLTLATHTPQGWLLDDDAVYTVALHEIGHLLGLGHSDDPRDVMSSTTTVHDLTPRDRRTARLLYALPPGSVRVPASRP